MQRFEYRVVPAPKKGEKTRAAKTTAERFAVALSTVMNALGQDGWEYVRADTLPCEERVGLTGSKVNFQNMLVFRRVLEEGAAALMQPERTIAAPEIAPPVLLPLPPAPPVEMERRTDTDAPPVLRTVPSARNDHAAG